MPMQRAVRPQGTANGAARGEGLLGATVDALAGTLGLRDNGTGDHSSDVLRLSCLLGRRLRLRARALRDLGYAARLHDIGKVGVPDVILHKAGPLDAPEWLTVRGHAAWGADLVAHIPGLERVARIVRHHHERFDGTGYPDGLAGEQILLEARIVAVAECWTAMTSPRPHRPALSETEALAELEQDAGRHLDARLLDALRPARGSRVDAGIGMCLLVPRGEDVRVAAAS